MYSLHVIDILFHLFPRTMFHTPRIYCCVCRESCDGSMRVSEKENTRGTFEFIFSVIYPAAKNGSPDILFSFFIIFFLFFLLSLKDLWRTSKTSTCEYRECMYSFPIHLSRINYRRGYRQQAFNVKCYRDCNYNITRLNFEIESSTEGKKSREEAFMQLVGKTINWIEFRYTF